MRSNSGQSEPGLPVRGLSTDLQSEFPFLRAVRATLRTHYIRRTSSATTCIYTCDNSAFDLPCKPLDNFCDGSSGASIAVSYNLCFGCFGEISCNRRVYPDGEHLRSVAKLLLACSPTRAMPSFIQAFTNNQIPTTKGFSNTHYQKPPSQCLMSHMTQPATNMPPKRRRSNKRHSGASREGCCGNRCRTRWTRTGRREKRQ